MAVSALRPIKLLHSFCDLTDFCQYREISTVSVFPSLWRSIFELLLINNYYEATLQLFLNTIYFFPKTHRLEFDKKHREFIMKFTNTLVNHSIFEVKSLLYGIEIFKLLKELSGFMKISQKESVFYSIKAVLNYNRVQVIEKTHNGSEIVWGTKRPYLQVFVLSLRKKLYFLHPKTRIKNLNLCTSSDLLMPFGIDCEDKLEKIGNGESLVVSQDEVLKKTEPLVDFQIEKYCASEDLEGDSYCGAVLCENCMKKLKRSSHFLINLQCCPYFVYNSKPPTRSPQLLNETTLIPVDSCSFCSKPCKRPEPIRCICCFLNEHIYKNTLKPLDSCQITEFYKWVDINSADSQEISLCGFCDKFRNKKYLCLACSQCGDQVCLTCLRRNPFISEGNCTPCSVKRIITFNNI